MTNQTKAWYSNIWIKISLSFILLFIISSQSYKLHAQSVSNSSEVKEGLHIKSIVGYDNKYVTRKPNLVQFTISNYYDRDIKGDLVLQIINDSGEEIAHIVPVEVAKGNTIDTHLTAEGKFTLKTTKLEFYENGFDKGKKLPFVGFDNIVGQSLDDQIVFGVVANDPDTLNFVSLFQNAGYPTKTIMLDEAFHANSSSDLSIFSVLAINDVDTSKWSQEKVNAIKDWIVSGGTLLIAGGASYAQSAAAFTDITPVSASSSTTLSDTSDILKFAGQTEPLAPIIVNQGQLQHGDMILDVNDIPIIASHSLGVGNVYYYAFDLGLKPFSTWVGNSSFLLNSLDQTLSSKYHNSYQYNYWNLTEAVQYFPRLKSPDISILLLIFFIYIVIVAPILYFIMKKFDRREWLWWMIPATAVLTTVTVLLVGSIGKGQLYVHKVNIAKVYEDRIVSNSAIRVFFPSGKDVEMPLDNVSIISLANNYSRYTEEPTNIFDRIVYHNHDQSSFEFRKNTYRTTKGLILRNDIQSTDEKGKIDVSISEADGKITVTVNNLTNEVLEHVSFFSGTSIYPLGDMAPGEQQTYDLPASFNKNISANININLRYQAFSHQLMQVKGWNWNEHEREVALLNDSVAFDSNHFVAAFSYSEEPQFILNNKKVKSDEMTMWVVDVEKQLLELDSSGVAIQARNANLVSSSGHYTKMHNNLFEMGLSTVQFEYLIPFLEATEGQQAEIISDIFRNYRTVKVLLFNVETGEWDVMSDAAFTIDPYIDEENKVRLQIDATNDYLEATLPILLLQSGVE